MIDLDEETGDKIMTLVAGLFGDRPYYVIQRRLRLLLVIVWNLMETRDRRVFLARLDDVEFDSSPLDMRTILQDWDRVMNSSLLFGWDKKFAGDVNEKRNKHSWWKPSKKQEPHVRAIYARILERDLAT